MTVAGTHEPDLLMQVENVGAYLPAELLRGGSRWCDSLGCFGSVTSSSRGDEDDS